ncbi:XRN 5'-3' exonuclease N-terminus-domain-containing protein [Pelagophyceae sp. CCMP2097]|nr:XRN 5'-3' exonuclease N-terminus-domain-containing protein [Pelagophyceae sp. CCMP2097]
MAVLVLAGLVAGASGFYTGGAPRAAPLRQLPVAHGIPKMFRWLTDQYPQIMERISDGLPADTDGEGGVDNLYLDMNGIIHMCTHSNEPELTSMSEREQFQRIFTFTDKVLKIVRPKKIIYLAVDGVAPRAKMNQQRARRFRSSLERELLLRDAKQEDIEGAFDSNCITPGTEFMHRLGLGFRAWLSHKFKTDPFYTHGPIVMFSGPDVPGEGEHKVMDFIRSEQAKKLPELQDLQHCFYGLDADLIMLSLVTHEPKFRLLREKTTVRHARGNRKPKDPLDYQRYDFELLEVGLLREMLELQFRPRLLPPGDAAPAAAVPVLNADGRYDFDLERVVDDFVFVCMLIGNDFLPHLPHLDIVDGSLDLMMMTYRELLPKMGGYLTNKDDIHLPRLELLLRSLSVYEPHYFKRRGASEGDAEYGKDDSYAAHYYAEKFGFAPDDMASRRAVARDYVLGLFWCVRYYHRGVKSWDWFYPHLYAPLASDVLDAVEMEFEFPSTGSRPFTPLMQLLSVLPPQSAPLLPQAYAEVMTSPTSRLHPAYPQTFSVDQNGKLAPWEAVVLIPFLDEDAMIAELTAIDHVTELSKKERARNDVTAATVWDSTRDVV